MPNILICFCAEAKAIFNRCRIGFFIFLFVLSFSNRSQARPAELSPQDIFLKESDSIVLIGAMELGEGHLGTGFIIRPDGLIVTNYHLIQGAKQLVVKLKNNQGFRRVQIVDFDAKKDIALIKIDGRNLKPLKLGNSNKISIGQRVLAIGNPLGLEGTVSDGLISAVRKTGGGFKVLQISVPLSNGSSGGPLFNMQGDVIGITTASNKQGQNLNFAVPINDVKPIIRRFESGRSPKNLPHMTTLANIVGKRIYTVQPKDTLYGIARRFSTSVDKIKRVNHLKDGHLHTGQLLKIP